MSDVDAIAQERPGGRGVFTAPNLVTSVRLGMVAVLLAVAWMGKPTLYLALLAFSMLTDWLDGLLARRLNQSSQLGAQLDSLGDFLTLLTVPLCAWWLWPETILREFPFVLAGLVSFLTPTVVGMIKFRRLPSLHTWGAKFATMVMGPSIIILLMGWSAWPFRAFMPFVVLEALEELVMIAVLPRWRANVPSVWHAWRIRLEMKGRDI